ncbi:hypothetical protein CFP56_040673 [Quercus suber]|uniref:Uncharacterized protein n=1 Tax=Quercus suber TaxID=58331 RepID=A0AAW0IX99_QUESU
MSSILRSLVIPSTKQDEFGGKHNLEITELHTKQLEGIKLFSILSFQPRLFNVLQQSHSHLAIFSEEEIHEDSLISRLL